MTELIWDGKYKDGKKQGPVRVALPFQTVETVNESAQDRQRTLELFAAGRETEWRNRLIWGDKKYVLPSLLPEFAGKVNLIYIDPPFDTGADFSFTATIPDHPDTPEDETAFFTKQPSLIEQKAYRDTWGRGTDSYLHWFYETVLLLRDLLSEQGCIYVHLGPELVHYARPVLDEVLGAANFRNAIVVKRRITKNLQEQFDFIHSLPQGNDEILWYSRSPATRFRAPRSAVSTRPEGYWHHFWSNADRPTMRYPLLGVKPAKGQWKWSEDRALEAVDNYKRYARDHAHKPLVEYWGETGRRLEFIRLSKKGKVENWFPPSESRISDTIWLDIHAYENEKEYPTQKHEELISRVVGASSNEDDLVLDCFVGSGTTAAVAEKLSRRWIACDLSRFAIHTTRKRLLGIPGVKPFIVQNLGKYERQAWQAAEFPGNGENSAEAARQRDLAYRNFILELYRATPISGHGWLHGCRGGRMVHVAPVDAPVTLADVKAIAKEVWKAAGTGKDGPAKAGVDILGWEFAFELNELARQVAAESRVDVAFKKIPREVLDKRAVEQGDINFFELGALKVTPKQKKREVTIRLADFLIPIDDIPEEVRKAIKHWSQMIDYWAVDWDFKDDTFHNQWQSYRTRKEPKIELEASHVYPEVGKYTVVIKVIDILGNDTTKAIEVDVR